MRLVTKYETDM